MYRETRECLVTSNVNDWTFCMVLTENQGDTVTLKFRSEHSEDSEKLEEAEMFLTIEEAEELVGMIQTIIRRARDAVAK